MHMVTALLGVYRAEIGLVLLACMFVAFLRERYPASVVAVLGACAYAALGLIDEKGLFSVFANPAPLTVAAMLVLSGALIRTGTINRVADLIMTRAQRHPRLALAEVTVGIVIISCFLNNTPVVVLLIPIVFKLAQATSIPVKKLLIPMNAVAVMGGCITLIGTSTNLIVAGIAAEQGMEPIGIFAISPYGIAGTVAGIATLACLSFLLPSDEPSIGGENGGTVQDYLTELVVPHDSDLVGREIGSLSLFSRSVVLLGLKRAGEIRRGDLKEEELHAGDRLIVRADGAAIMTLRESGRFELGIAADSETSSHEGTVIEAMVAPSHPSTGERLMDIPFLHALRVRIIGMHRSRHLAGPDLGDARVRGADRLLIAGSDDAVRSLRDNPHLMGVDISRTRAFRRNKAWIAILSMAAVVTFAALNVISIGLAAFLAVGVILVTRCIDAEEAWSAIDGDVLVLIFAMLAVGLALEQAGSVALMVGWITPLLEVAPTWSLVFVIYFFALILSELLSNNAVAALMTPITIALARQLGVDPLPLVIALMIGASACFATPIGYQTNALVHAAGDYRFADFVRIGVPLNIVVGLAVCTTLVLLN
ncbi:di/tricarboxylate transporter [Sphingobium wenxiniae]|jgi:di/tricarboxylate transporter|uniref:TrkA family protein n=1 Tax=Sphingobium wenxiniae (strain DSM 21828 / CGMCC 1.7748 / JZ-1) TaxID=595605 RepID=A0A562KCV3_SPHWJ|nr:MULTISPECIES: SLC13 family permease [Sphingobium]MBB6191468.1 di/tricarboxylate transporter [Sphingobium wenxiniae]TWH93240.1 TrkA family protein [Sphingobium wenxiniae]WRD76214.1 SLC13 family permease [Sphingobium baderi]